MNVIVERIPFNVHFKKPTAPTYMEQLKQMETDGMVSLRGLRKDATLFDEIVIDVNTMYFERNGGYEYAKQFYEEGILSALRTGRANPTSWKCRNSSLWSFGRWSAGTGIFSNGTSGTGSLTRYGTKPFTDGRCVCLRALMNAWLRKNGMKRSIRRLGAFQRYKGGVSCSTTSMSSIFTKSPLWSIAPLRQYRNLLRLQRRK